MNKTTLIWDWNGTLLDDLWACLASINRLLEKRALPPLNRKLYREVFSFPVKEYYAAIGFDFSKEDFEIPAQEFIDLYNQLLFQCKLHHSANDALSCFASRGARQFVLSAMEQSMLTESLTYNKIFHYFEGVAGLDNHYAASKIERGEQLISTFGIDKGNSWMIGDTIHDYEVAQALGIRCVLISDGHQSIRRLKVTGAPVYKSLNELIKRYPSF